MTFKVSIRLDDIFFDETFDTDLEALERAKAWTKARLGEVTIAHNARLQVLKDAILTAIVFAAALTILVPRR